MRQVAFVTAANNGTFGEELDAYLLDTRVVLSLGAFDDDAEWKMTRFLKPLANRRYARTNWGAHRSP